MTSVGGDSSSTTLRLASGAASFVDATGAVDVPPHAAQRSALIADLLQQQEDCDVELPLPLTMPEIRAWLDRAQPDEINTFTQPQRTLDEGARLTRMPMAEFRGILECMNPKLLDKFPQTYPDEEVDKLIGALKVLCQASAAQWRTSVSPRLSDTSES